MQIVYMLDDIKKDKTYRPASVTPRLIFIRQFSFCSLDLSVL